MANRVRRRAGARASKSGRRRSAALQGVLDLALDMEEPLRHATWFLRVLEQCDGQNDPQADALSFVAGEARVQLETVEDLWNKLCDVVKGG